jgi:hypothetical protein
VTAVVARAMDAFLDVDDRNRDVILISIVLCI